MLNSQLQCLNSYPPFFLSPKPSILFHGFTSLPVHPCQHFLKRNTNFCIRANYNVGAKTGSSSMGAAIDQNPVSIKAVVRVKVTTGEFFSNLGLTKPVDDFTDFFGKTLLLELISAELDPNTGLERETIKAYAHGVSHKSDEVKYESSFAVPASFGKVGAILLENEHHKEMYVNNIILEGFPNGPLYFTCNSWVHSKYDNPHKRIFFTNKVSTSSVSSSRAKLHSCLPSDTPSGLKRLRELELENVRGTGEGKRKTFERIYDYDTYNDLGDQIKAVNWHDLSLEAKTTHTQGAAEQDVYVVKRGTKIPKYCKKHPLSEQRSSSVYVPRDEAFSEVKQDWPKKSKLDPKIYGLPETLITTELVEQEIRGIMTVNEALKSKRLFVLDYHDLLLPYVNKVREVEGTTLYGSRALFFLTKDGTLRPVAIELTWPPIGDKPQWKQVFTPTWDATGCWLWRLAKAHAKDSLLYRAIHNCS
ncbi:linoleate 13s-lipoxygenase 2-1 [Quercus suber]|uniref:Linoleate 13s-lipoxygenase 2-1 n=1 Tax=Quercus suber TaxID=58331 RepID=A0AAW0LF49_QUESU